MKQSTAIKELAKSLSAVHFVIQGKGGCSKTSSSGFLAQYLASKGAKPVCADLDPVNQSFSKYKSLDVTFIDITQNKLVVTSKFEPLMVKMLEVDANFVLDNGASTFLPMLSYIAENDVLRIMHESGKRIFLHSPLQGEEQETYDGFCETVKLAGEYAKVVVWANEHFGPCEFEGIPIIETAGFIDAQAAGKIAGLVRVADRKQSDTYSKDLKLMLNKRMTLDDVLADTRFNVFSRSRMSTVVNDIFKQLDSVNWQ